MSRSAKHALKKLSMRTIPCIAVVGLAGLLIGGCGGGGGEHQAHQQRPVCKWEPELCDGAARRAWVRGQ